MQNKSKLQKVMSAVFNLPVDLINENSSPDNIGSWDSLKHMNLILALEEEFNVSLTEDQVVEILGFELIVEVLKEHGIEF